MVTSSCLCKKPEGAVFPFVLLIHSVEDGVDDSVYALDVDEADHGSGAASHLHEASLDDIGGAQLSPQVAGKAEEGEQLRQVSLQSLHHRRVGAPPVRLKNPKSGLRGFATLREVDCLGLGLHRIVVRAAHLP